MLILRKIFGVVTELIPVVGDVVENVKSRDGGVGRFLTQKFIKQIIRLIVAVATVYLVLSGKIDPEMLNDL